MSLSHPYAYRCIKVVKVVLSRLHSQCSETSKFASLTRYHTLLPHPWYLSAFSLVPAHQKPSPPSLNLLSAHCTSQPSLLCPVPPCLPCLSPPAPPSSVHLVPAPHVPPASCHLTPQLCRQLHGGNKGLMFSFSILWLEHTRGNHRL